MILTLVEYINARTKVKIICPEHGIFEQTPDNHLKYECLKCSIITNANKQRKTLEEFIIQANEIHNKFYSYDKTIYLNDKTKIEIECPIHGIFKQQPSNHLWGKGCPSCGNTSKGENKVE
jgi:hypothetical protein